MKTRLMTAALIALMIVVLVTSPVASQGDDKEMVITGVNLRPPIPEEGYQWVDSGTSLYTVSVEGVQYDPGIVVGAYMPEVFKAAEARPVYIYVTRLSEDVSALDAKMLPLTPTGNAFGVNFCGGIGVEAGWPRGLSWYIHLSAGYTLWGRTRWDSLWRKHIPISASALAQSTEDFEGMSLDVAPERIAYEQISDIPYREWDGPFTTDVTVQSELRLEIGPEMEIYPPPDETWEIEEIGPEWEIIEELEPMPFSVKLGPAFTFEPFEIPVRIVEAETPILEIQLGSLATVEFDKIDVKGLTINAVEEEIAYTSLKVRQLSDVPPNITALSENVYGYFTINIDLEDDGVRNVDIEFKVEKAWLAERELDESTVRLNRYDPADEVWIPLPTEKIGEDSLYVHYSATSPGLSLFAVTAEAARGAPIAIWLGVGLGIGAIIALLAYLLLVRKRPKAH